MLETERPPVGDELRAATPRRDHGSLGFALLNRGKRSVPLALEAPAIPLPLDRQFVADSVTRASPRLGEANALLGESRQ